MFMEDLEKAGVEKAEKVETQLMKERMELWKK